MTICRAGNWKKNIQFGLTSTPLAFVNLRVEEASLQIMWHYYGMVKTKDFALYINNMGIARVFYWLYVIPETLHTVVHVQIPNLLVCTKILKLEFTVAKVNQHWAPLHFRILPGITISWHYVVVQRTDG